jgi:hypothetical protein
MFLCFSGALLIETTKYGEVYPTKNGIATIYVNGVQVAKEEDFMFSYNITNINAQVKKALNRERSNVGRTAYSDTVKNILKQCKSEGVLLTLVKDLENVMRGTNKDESSWVDVASYAAKTLHKIGNVVFLTPTERSNLTNQHVEILEQSGKKLVMITDNVYEKIKDDVTTFSNVYFEYQENFKYKFVGYDSLSEQERNVFDSKDIVITFLKKHQYRCNVSVRISETIRVGIYGESTMGVCDPSEGIIIKRSVLRDPVNFKGVLVHEFAHFVSGASDNTREFENILTDMLGQVLSDLSLEEKVANKQSLLGKIFGNTKI